MNGNDFVAWLLRSPLYPLMGSTMLLTVAGRKSGRRIALPVNYVREGDTLWVISSRERKWWRNLVRAADVTVHIAGQERRGVGEAVLDEECVAQQLGQYVMRFPASRQALGVRVEGGRPKDEDIRRAARERLLVRICLE